MSVALFFPVFLSSSSSSSSLHFSRVSPLLFEATTFAILVWVLLLGAFALFTRPRPVEPDAPTMDLGPEPPAVADFLVNHGRVTPRAIPGTLLDLAARHYLQVEEFTGADTLIRIQNPATPDLTKYETQVLEHISSVAENGVVPLQALTLGTDTRVQRWRNAFYKEVIADANKRGLAEPRWNIQTWTIQRFVGFIAGLLVLVVMTQAGSFILGTFVVGAGFMAAHGALEKIFGSQSLTPAGYTAASHWLGVRDFMAQGEAFHSLPAGSVVLWDRYMAYATVFGLARTTLASMPMGVEDEHHAWSAFGGNWHGVRIIYPRSRIIWGRTPAGGLAAGLVIGAIGAIAVYLMLGLHGIMKGGNDEVSYYVRLGSLIAAAVGVAGVAWGVATLRLAFADFGSKREVDGAVVRCRAIEQSENSYSYFLAVDEGTAPETRAWRVDQATYNRINEGDVIHATISRNCCHVYKIDVVKASRIVASPVVPDEVPAKEIIGPLASFRLEAAALGPEELVTAQDAATALGEPVKPAQDYSLDKVGMPLPHACFYAAQSGKQAGVSVGAARGPMVTVLSRMNASRAGEEIPVAGGKAYLHGNAIAVILQDTAVMITVQGSTRDTETALRELATQVAFRLAAAPVDATT